MWSGGTYKTYTYFCKRYDEPSAEFGYKGSRISKLEIRNWRWQIVFNYDRGMDIDAQDERTQEVLDYVMSIYG